MDVSLDCHRKNEDIMYRIRKFCLVTHHQKLLLINTVTNLGNYCK